MSNDDASPEAPAPTRDAISLNHDYVLVRPVERGIQVNRSGLYIPISSERNQTTGQRDVERVGEVVHVGPGALTDQFDLVTNAFRRRPMHCKPGDLVMIMGTWRECIHNGEKLALGQDYQIVGIITPGAEAEAEEPKMVLVLN